MYISGKESWGYEEAFIFRSILRTYNAILGALKDEYSQWNIRALFTTLQCFLSWKRLAVCAMNCSICGIELMLTAEAMCPPSNSYRNLQSIITNSSTMDAYLPLIRSTSVSEVIRLIASWLLCEWGSCRRSPVSSEIHDGSWIEALWTKSLWLTWLLNVRLSKCVDWNGAFWMLWLSEDKREQLNLSSNELARFEMELLGVVKGEVGLETFFCTKWCHLLPLLTAIDEFTWLVGLTK